MIVEIGVMLVVFYVYGWALDSSAFISANMILSIVQGIGLLVFMYLVLAFLFVRLDKWIIGTKVNAILGCVFLFLGGLLAFWVLAFVNGAHMTGIDIPEWLHITIIMTGAAIGFNIGLRLR